MKSLGIKEENKEEIIGYLKEGKTSKAIGEIFGCSHNVVNNFIHKHNLSKYRPKINWEENKERLRKLRTEDNLSLTEIAKLFNVNPRTIWLKTKEFGFVKEIGQSKAEKLRQEKRICPICGKYFTPNDEEQVYCSPECSLVYIHKKVSKIPPKEILLEKLEENNWNYKKTGEGFKTNGTTVIGWSKKYGIHKPKLRYWSDVVDLESAQRKIDELGIKTIMDIHNNYPGLGSKLKRMKLIRSLKFPGLGGFDSKWEKDLFNLIKDNITFTSLEHNVTLDQECKNIKSLKFDIVLEYSNSKKVAIEIQGPYHFKDVFKSKEVVKKNDEIKYEYCVSHGIDLYYFTYDQSLLDTYGYPHYVYTDENLLLEKLKSYSLPSL